MATTDHYNFIIYGPSSLISDLVNDNWSRLDTILYGYGTNLGLKKNIQADVSDPVASGTGVEFISGITQNQQGVISPSKKTVRTMGGATASAAGSTGLVPAPAAGAQGKFLRGDGTWQNVASPGTATASAFGLVKIGYTQNGKNYPVQLSDGKMFVNVPWTDNNTTYSQATSSALGLVKIGYTQNGKNYPVQLSNGQMYVNVPWTDTNTTYGNASQSAAGLMSAADKKKLDGIAPGAQVNPGNFSTSGAGLVPASGNNNNLLAGNGWTTLKDLFDRTQAVAITKVNNNANRIEVKYGSVDNVQAIGNQASKLFENAFGAACIAVIPILKSFHSGTYARINMVSWDQNGFTYRAQTGEGGNISFAYIAFGVS